MSRYFFGGLELNLLYSLSKNFLGKFERYKNIFLRGDENMLKVFFEGGGVVKIKYKIPKEFS